MGLDSCKTLLECFSIQSLRGFKGFYGMFNRFITCADDLHSCGEFWQVRQPCCNFILHVLKWSGFIVHWFMLSRINQDWVSCECIHGLTESGNKAVRVRKNA